MAIVGPSARHDRLEFSLCIDITFSWMSARSFETDVRSWHSDSFAQALGRLDHDLELLGCELPADRHQATIGREPDLIQRQMLEHAGDTPLDRVHRWCRAVARVDAAEHHDPVAARREHLRIELAAAELHREAADARLHQLRQYTRVLVLVLRRAAEARITVAEMHQRGHCDALKTAVERLGAIVAQ